MKCKCGNDSFFAHQVCHLDIKVDGDNNFLETLPEDCNGGSDSVYESETPYGPYTCTECGTEYPDLSERRGKLIDVQKDIKDKF